VGRALALLEGVEGGVEHALVAGSRRRKVCNDWPMLAPYLIGRPVSKVKARSSPSAGNRRSRLKLWDGSARIAYSPNSAAFSLSGGFRVSWAISRAATK
jgi:hypothetical protein